MEIPFAVLIIGLLCVAFQLPAFEAAIGLLLLTPIAAYPLGLVAPLSVWTYAAAFIFLFLSLNSMKGWQRPRFPIGALAEEGAALGFFVVSFCIFSYLCHLWPEFYQLGERFRDYAVLGSVIKSPIEAREPWLAGAPLNYYLYWYRFGHFLGTVFRLPIWEVYHQLQSCTFALLATSIFVLFRKFAEFRLWTALAASAIVTVGSNVEGVRFFFNARDAGWWGPSRVIPGAINEFPAWSFLLGDVHPHYLNLGLIPFLSLVFLNVSRAALSPLLRLLSIFGVLAVGTLWIYNSNAWEMPVWVGLSALYFALFLLTTPVSRVQRFFRDELEWHEWSSPHSLLLIGLLLYFVASLALSSLNIVPAHMPLHLVSQPIPRTNVIDLLRHWGIPLAIMAVSSCALLGRAELWAGAAFALAASFFFGQAWVVLTLLLALNFFRLYWCYFSDEAARPSRTDIAFESFGIVGLLLILFPEIAFFDDSYGGENERMNTIFKAYSAAWFMLHSFAFHLTAQASRRVLKTEVRATLQPIAIAIVIVCCGFFCKTMKYRKSAAPTVMPYTQGLSEMDRRFAGAATTVQVLANSRPGTVLEAQGPAYDVTTHIATLSSQPSYLGWVNHLNLLLKLYDEVDRRVKLTDQFYREADCAKRKEIAARENIKYIVVGPLEKKAYGNLPPEGFSCFQQLVKAQEYLVFGNS